MSRGRREPARERKRKKEGVGGGGMTDGVNYIVGNIIKVA